MNLDQFNFELSKQRHEELFSEAQRRFAVGLLLRDQEHQRARPLRSRLLLLRRWWPASVAKAQAGGRL
jgi:hypothetical protein